MGFYLLFLQAIFIIGMQPSKIGKSIIFSAPSGAGKTTIVQQLLKQIPQLAFSVSACSREKRPNETHGVDYYFLGVEGFKNAIKNNELMEWEEVYPNQFYGTLTSELQNIWNNNKIVIFDVDVVGGLKLKEKFGENALAIFVLPPDINTLEKRLTKRATETPEKIAMRVNKAKQEILLAPKFDCMVENLNLHKAVEVSKNLILNFIKN